MDSSNRLLDELKKGGGISQNLRNVLGLHPLGSIHELGVKELRIPLMMAIECLKPIMKYIDGFYPIRMHLTYPFMGSGRVIGPECLNHVGDHLHMPDDLVVNMKALVLGSLISEWVDETAHEERLLMMSSGKTVLWQADYSFRRQPPQHSCTLGDITHLSVVKTRFLYFSPEDLEDRILHPERFPELDKAQCVTLYRHALEALHHSVRNAVEKKEMHLRSMRDTEKAVSAIRFRLNFP